jgi:hypothetical protein
MKTFLLHRAQKELLKWHWKMGIGMYCIQEMIRERHYVDPDGMLTILPVASPHMQSVIVSCSLPCTVATCSGNFCREAHFSRKKRESPPSSELYLS